MSAFIVSKNHINTIVNFVSSREDLSAEQSQEIGQELWEENHKSVNYRYKEKEPTPVYIFESATFDNEAAGRVANAVNCLRYQSCEHEGWLESEAFHITNSILIDLTRLLPGYEDAPWGIE